MILQMTSVGEQLKLFLYLIFIFALQGCAKGKVDILSQNGEVLGACTANFDWHWYGAQDSVNYILYKCVKGHHDSGKLLSDYALFENDYTLPAPPDGQTWNRQNAYNQFKAGEFSEQKYGYILAEIEYRFMLTQQKSQLQLSSGSITKEKYNQQIDEAKAMLNGG